jgi:hypothetical protein
MLYVHVDQNYLVGLQRTVRNATDLRKTQFIPKGVKTYTKVGGVKTESSLVQT